jgi:alkanesulfonate monooxygenase SsuD/methylene tetrahydromethanopterin reductase-like flavin-dependent oxidoreductase (luciferase family)
MKFAVSYSTPYYGVDPDKIMTYAQHAEACGFESLYLPERIVLYPGARVGPTEIPPSLPYADPLDCLSFIAAATQRILLGTGVLLVPYHHPVVLAKRLATIDVLRLLWAGGEDGVSFTGSSSA